MDLETLKERRDQLCLNFAKNSIKNETLKNLFPINRKNHQMTTRKPEKYQVLHCNTERLKNSAIPQMQISLNIDDQQNKKV